MTMNNNMPTRSDSGVSFFLILVVLALLLSLLACSSTGTEHVRIDQTDRRDAVQTEAPDTVTVERVRTDTLWMPGMTLTVPETVEVAREEPTARDTTDAFPLKEVAVDSAQVRLSGLTERHILAAPCLGQRLIGRSVQGEMEFYVEGDCVARDTTIECTYEKESWIERTTDKLARWFSLVALVGFGMYLLWGTLETAIRAALPW